MQRKDTAIAADEDQLVRKPVWWTLVGRSKVAESEDQVLYEATFVRPNKTSFITVRITVPRQEGETEWVCSFQLLGVGQDNPQRGVGSDSLQCIRIVSEFIRRCLIPLNVLEVKTKAAPETIFPG